MTITFLVVAVMALLVGAAARRFGLLAPLVLVLVGFVIGWIPGLPDFTLDPDVVLFIILPPLLYSAALDSSYVAFRRNMGPISSMAIGLPLFTTVCVAVVAYYCVPEMTWPAAFVLGAVVAPPDAVSAQAIARRVGLPRRVTTLLGGESLLNDATSLTALRIALAAVVGTAASAWSGLLLFAEALVGGLLVGLAVAFVVAWIRRILDDPPMETAIGLVVPFGIYLLAEELNTSGVIAVVTAGLYLGQRSARAGYATRMADNAVWRSVEVLLESFVFLLIGLQLPDVARSLRGHEPGVLTIAAVAVFAVVIVSRFVWLFVATYTRRAVKKRLGLQQDSKQDALTANEVTVLSWSGMRGVVTLAAAFSVPLIVNGHDFPARDEIVFLAFVVVVGTLLLQGTTLPWVIRALGVRGDDWRKDLISLAAAQDRAAKAADKRLDEFDAKIGDDDPRKSQIEVLRKWIASRKNLAWEELGRGADEIGESPGQAFNRMRTALVQTQREVFVNERDNGRIDDEVLRRVLRDLDLAEGLSDRKSIGEG